MAGLGFDAASITWNDRVVSHALAEFPDLERLEYDGTTVRAYADRAPSIHALFRDAVDRVPDREFVVFPHGGHRFSYGEFDERIEAVGAGLEGEGVGTGDRVAMILPNEPAFLEVFFACARLGAVCVPLNTRLTADDYEMILGDVAPDLLIGRDDTLAELDLPALSLGERTMVVDGDGPAAYEHLATDGPVAATPPAETDRVCIFYTSGTTGRPKGCPADHFHLTNAAANYRHSFGLTDGTVGLTPVPLFHVTGLVSSLVATLSVAGTGVVLEEFATDRFLGTIDAEAVNYVIGVPTNFVLALEREDPTEYDLSSLEVCTFGGAPMSSAMIPRLREAFPNAAICNGYGKTETF